MMAHLLTGFLLVAQGDIPVYDKQYTREKTIRPTAPNSYRIYDKQWRPEGTIQTHPDGSIDIFNNDWTRRIPTLRPTTPVPPERPRK
jgi:hypothetical protein